MKENISDFKIAKNSFWNLVGFILPALLGIITIPLIIKNIGVESMGLLTIIWTCIGYFSLFDFGVSRALTFTISDLIGKKRWPDLSFHIFSGLVIIFFFGLLGTSIVYFGNSFLVSHFLNPSPNLLDSTEQSLIYMAISLPFILLTTGVRGILESFSAFKELNIIKVGMGLFNFISPYLISIWTTRLDIIVLVLVFGRVIFCFWHFRILEIFLRSHPESEVAKKWWNKNNIKRFQFWSKEVRFLFNFSSWLTLSNIIVPIMVYADRFLIAKFFTAAETAYYTIPFEAVSKIWILPGAISGVLFPTFTKDFSSLFHLKETTDVSSNKSVQFHMEKIISLYESSFKFMLAVLIPVTLIVGFFSKEILHLWLNEEFAYRSTVVFIILGFGVISNCFGHISFALIQGSGASRFTAICHVIEFSIYMVLVYFFTKELGIVGTALAWFFRVVIDNLLLMSYIYYKIDRKFQKIHQMTTYLLGGIVSLVCLLSTDLVSPPLSLSNFLLKISVTLLIAFLSFYFFQKYFLNENDKNFIVNLIAKIKPILDHKLLLKKK